MKYNKPYLIIPEQVSLLESRGLKISNKPKAEHYLAKIGYYRLSGYAHIFRQLDADGETILDKFKDGSHFENIHALYVFDKQLRLLILDALERIEIAFRVDVALELGKHDSLAHLKPDYFHSSFVKIRGGQKSSFNRWQDKYSQTFENSTDDFVKHFKHKYAKSKMPIWMSTELWDFGMLSKYLSGMKDSYVAPIADKYDLATYKILRSWLRTMNVTRNICPHHGRLWNRVLAISPQYPLLNDVPLLNPLLKEGAPSNRIFATLCIIQYFMRHVSPNSTWKERVKEHIDSLPASPYICISAMGTTDGWKEWPLWK